MTLYDFAVRLLKHRGIFPAELPPARMAAAILAAVRETYASGGGDFGGISATPGFIPALARTLSDLEEGCVGDAETRVDGKGGEGPGRRPKGGAVGGVAAAAGVRGPEGSGDGGGDATPDLPGGGGGIRAARLSVPRNLVRLLRLHPASVDAGRTAPLFRPAGRGLLPRALRRRGKPSSFVPVRRQGVGSSARRLRGERGVPDRRPRLPDRVRARADLLSRPARGSDACAVHGPLRSPRGRGDAARRPAGPDLARRFPRGFRFSRRQEGDPGDGGRLGTDRRGVRHRHGGAPRRPPLFRPPCAPPPADDRGHAGQLPAPGGDRRPLVPVSSFCRGGGRYRRAARPVGSPLEGAPGRFRVRLGNAVGPASAAAPRGGG